MKQAQKLNDNLLVAVHVLPRAKRDEIEGEVIDSAGKKWLKVRLTATPEDGKANKALIRLLAKEWGCAPSCLSIVSGELSRHKIIKKDV
jgi:uncharacterized protein (TIGR00251 family)